MTTAPHPTPTRQAERFIASNLERFVEYASVTYDYKGDPNGILYRLDDGETFPLTTADCRSLDGFEPRWRHLSGPLA